MHRNYREAYAQTGAPSPLFGLTQQHETAFKFQNALQRSDEHIEEWAQGTGTLADCMFESSCVGFSPRDTAAMIRKFCSGSLDEEAGVYAVSKRPESLSEGITHMRQYQMWAERPEHPPYVRLAKSRIYVSIPLSCQGRQRRVSHSLQAICIHSLARISLSL